MASIIKVDQIQTAAGSTPTAADLGLNTTGSVLQVKQTLVNTIATYSAPNGTPVEITELRTTFTPTSATSKVMLELHLTYATLNTTYTVFPRRNGSDIADVIGAAAGSRQRGTAYCPYHSDQNQGQPSSFKVFDSPTTASEITYSIWINNDNTQAFYLNRSINDGDAAVGKRCVSTLTITEIAG